jgi:hypothetical protein
MLLSLTMRNLLTTFTIALLAIFDSGVKSRKMVGVVSTSAKNNNIMGKHSQFIEITKGSFLKVVKSEGIK